MPDTHGSAVILRDAPKRQPLAMTNETQIGQLVSSASETLSEISESPRLDAELMLAQTLDLPRSYLIAHPEEELDDVTLQRFRALLDRRTSGEPIAYISGTREFWSMPLIVSPATLVPRPETEILVDVAISNLPRKAKASVLDLGTGSGAVALAIAKERPLVEVVATDKSAEAIAVAAENARQLALPNVEFAVGDWIEPVLGRRFDMIVSNPPYVADNDPALAALQFEPASALVAGSDGLDAIRKLVDECRQVIKQDGWLMIEHGAGQKDQVENLLTQHGWQDIDCRNDYAGLPRVSRGRFVERDDSGGS